MIIKSEEVRGQVLFCAFRLVGLYKILKKQETRPAPQSPLIDTGLKKNYSVIVYNEMPLGVNRLR